MGYSSREVLDPQQDIPDFADGCGEEADAITPTKNDHEDGTAGSGTPFPADIDALLSLGTIAPSLPQRYILTMALLSGFGDTIGAVWTKARHLFSGYAGRKHEPGSRMKYW